MQPTRYDCVSGSNGSAFNPFQDKSTVTPYLSAPSIVGRLAPEISSITLGGVYAIKLAYSVYPAFNRQRSRNHKIIEY